MMKDLDLSKDDGLNLAADHVMDGALNRDAGTTERNEADPPPATARDIAGLAWDMTRFVLWLRNNTDFFGGPGLDQHHPAANDPEFYEVLGDLALKYTGE